MTNEERIAALENANASLSVANSALAAQVINLGDAVSALETRIVALEDGKADISAVHLMNARLSDLVVSD